MENPKSLIVYYSRRGKNFVGGSIINLPIGNTERIALKLQALTGSDIFQIETQEPYPEDYTETTLVSFKEHRENARPELKETLSAIDSYKVIYIGYPNWWGTMPMALFTFLEAHQFSGRTIIPFCTHEGSGMGSSERDLKKLCPNANVLSGLVIRGSRVNEADEAIAEWINGSLSR